MEGTADQCEAWAEGTSRQTPRSTHRCTQPFTLFGAVWRFAAALWRRLGAPLGLPSSAGCASRWDHCRPVRHLLCWPHRLSPQPSDGSAPAGVMAEPARLSPHCPRCTPQRVCRRSERAASVCGPLPSAAHRVHVVLRCTFLLRPLSLICGRCQIAQLRTGLCGHSERQWKETVG